MVSFEQFRPISGTPIYYQIILYIKRGMVAGTVLDGDEMPSRRVLSSLLGVNPNTIQKAYHLLEEEGLIASRAGAKSYVSLTTERTADIRRQLLQEDARTLVFSMRQMGISRMEALDFISELWEEEL